MDPPANVDWSGVAHAPAGARPRIACLVPSLTELLFALELGEYVVARTGFCVHPRAARPVPKVGGTKDPDLDRLRALAPSHLIVNVDENTREIVAAAREFVAHVIVTHPVHPAENARLYRLFGLLFGRVREAELLAQELTGAMECARVAALALPREDVLYLIWRNPWMTVSRATYVSATLALAGWDTVPEHAELRYPVVADDDAAWRNARRILLSTEPFAFRERDAVALAAQRYRSVHLVDGEWTSWYGVRAIAGIRSLTAMRAAILG